MRPFLSTALLLALVAAQSAGAADLTKIERKIAKEPTYKSDDVKYCLVVLGKEASQRIWIAATAKQYFIDANGNGDLTEEDERFKVTRKSSRHEVPLGKGRELRVDLDEEGEFSLVYTGEGVRTQYARPKGAGKPAAAPIVHFDGPLTLHLDDEEIICDGEDAPEMYARVGTLGLGEGTFASISTSGVPGDAHPTAELEIPAKDSASKPIRVQVHLRERC